MAEPWLIVDNIAEHLGVTNGTIHSWIAEKPIPARKIRCLLKFPVGEIGNWVRAGSVASGRERPVSHPGVVGCYYNHDNEEYGEG